MRTFFVTCSVLAILAGSTAFAGKGDPVANCKGDCVMQYNACLERSGGDAKGRARCSEMVKNCVSFCENS